MNFIKRTLEALPYHPTDIVTYHDTTQAGLKLLVRPGGTKTFVLYRKINGKPERIKLGRFPQTTIEQARKKIDLLNAKIAENINPNQEKRSFKEEVTLEEIFAQYMERHAKLHKKSWEEDEAQFNRYLTRWANKKLSAITKVDIQKLHIAVGDKNGTYAANRLLALLHGLFNKAREWGWEHDNPAQYVKKFREKSRERFLQSEELPLFFQAVSEESNDIARDYILISLLTGARKSNVLAMQWNEISLENGTWQIPDTKNNSSHLIPLLDEAINILQNRKAANESNSPWVFPGTGATGHLMEPKKAWKRILDKANIENLRLHDLRRSLGSWQAATGASLSIIGKTLAHKSVNATAIYARLNIDPVREAMDKATQAIFKAGKYLEKSN